MFPSSDCENVSSVGIESSVYRILYAVKNTFYTIRTFEIKSKYAILCFGTDFAQSFTRRKRLTSITDPVYYIKHLYTFCTLLCVPYTYRDGLILSVNQMLHLYVEWNAQNYIICFSANSLPQHSGWYVRYISSVQMLTEWHFFSLVQEFPVRSDSSASLLYETELAQVQETFTLCSPVRMNKVKIVRQFCEIAD